MSKLIIKDNFVVKKVAETINLKTTKTHRNRHRHRKVKKTVKHSFTTPTVDDHDDIDEKSTATDLKVPMTENTRTQAKMDAKLTDWNHEALTQNAYHHSSRAQDKIDGKSANLYPISNNNKTTASAFEALCDILSNADSEPSQLKSTVEQLIARNNEHELLRSLDLCLFLLQVNEHVHTDIYKTIQSLLHHSNAVRLRVETLIARGNDNGNSQPKYYKRLQAMIQQRKPVSPTLVKVITHAMNRAEQSEGSIDRRAVLDPWIRALADSILPIALLNRFFDWFLTFYRTISLDDALLFLSVMCNSDANYRHYATKDYLWRVFLDILKHAMEIHRSREYGVILDYIQMFCDSAKLELGKQLRVKISETLEQYCKHAKWMMSGEEKQQLKELIAKLQNYGN
eukprot:727656_1